MVRVERYQARATVAQRKMPPIHRAQLHQGWGGFFPAAFGWTRENWLA